MWRDLCVPRPAAACLLAGPVLGWSPCTRIGCVCVYFVSWRPIKVSKPTGNEKHGKTTKMNILCLRHGVPYPVMYRYWQIFPLLNVCMVLENCCAFVVLILLRLFSLKNVK